MNEIWNYRMSHVPLPHQWMSSKGWWLTAGNPFASDWEGSHGFLRGYTKGQIPLDELTILWQSKKALLRWNNIWVINWVFKENVWNDLTGKKSQRFNTIKWLHHISSYNFLSTYLWTSAKRVTCTTAERGSDSELFTVTGAWQPRPQSHGRMSWINSVPAEMLLRT